LQPAESRSRRVAFRTDASSSSRYTATVSLLSATISISLIICESGMVLPYVRAHTHKNRVRIAEWPFIFRSALRLLWVLRRAHLALPEEIACCRTASQRTRTRRRASQSSRRHDLHVQ